MPESGDDKGLLGALERSVKERISLAAEKASCAPKAVRAARDLARVILREELVAYFLESLPVAKGTPGEPPADWKEHVVSLFEKYAETLLGAYVEAAMPALDADTDADRDFLRVTVTRGLIRQILPRRSMNYENLDPHDPPSSPPNGEWEVAMSKCWRSLTAKGRLKSDEHDIWCSHYEWWLRWDETRSCFFTRLRQHLEDRLDHWEADPLGARRTIEPRGTPIRGSETSTASDSLNPDEASPTSTSEANTGRLPGIKSVNYKTAAGDLGVTERQIRNLVRQGSLERVGGGHRKKITIESLRRYMGESDPSQQKSGTKRN